MNPILEALTDIDRAAQAAQEIYNMVRGQSELSAVAHLALFTRRRCEDAAAALELQRERC